jgi:hypothetical protein
MAIHKKRPQYIIEMVNKTNDYLRFRKVTETSDTLFCFMCDYLLKKQMYQGYNFFKDVYNTYLKKNVPTEAGSYKEGEFDYLQIY